MKPLHQKELSILLCGPPKATTLDQGGPIKADCFQKLRAINTRINTLKSRALNPEPTKHLLGETLGLKSNANPA